MSDLAKTSPMLGTLGIVLALSLGGPSLPVLAQGQRLVEGQDFVCMARTRDEAGEKTTRIVVPARSHEVMQAKGFETFDCDAGGFPRAEQARFRDEVCGITADQPEGMQQQLEGVFGERPAVLCAMAEIVVGEWDAREAQSK